jgi:hypothetical protein
LVEEFIEEQESCVYFIFCVYFSFNLTEPSRAMIVICEIPTTALARKDRLPWGLHRCARQWRIAFRGVYTAALGKEGGWSSSFGASASECKSGGKALCKWRRISDSSHWLHSANQMRWTHTYKLTNPAKDCRIGRNPMIKGKNSIYSVGFDDSR